MNEFKIPEIISLNTIGDLEISTVKLNDAALEKDLYETCLFYTNGDSTVVAQYKTLAAAIRGHNRLVQHEFEHNTIVKIQH